MNQFKLPKTQASYYLNYKQEMAHTISAAPMEKEDPEALIEAILAEFSQSSAVEKEKFKIILEEWLLQASEEEIIRKEAALLTQAPEAVINNIYEMF